ncbi:MAG: tRNA 2-thiouridine(34) synthase MnmA [Candidatus Pacebacteria bacterium]|nr:tRNA 2-thiouridine(34) synthase MnmA [Candidatus Paceibacterota bacterium]
MKKDITVAVGMSGGVDSTMTALILKEKGYKVIGLTMKIWDNNPNIKGTKSGCYGPNEAKDIAEAQKAAKLLDIPHYIVDLKEEYHQAVIEYFKNEYQKGKTPNPCVVCNAKIKFGLLIEKALNSGIKFDHFATGHYVRVVRDEDTGSYLLKKGVDKTKDQSYFLYRLKQKQLKKLIFPLGNKKKIDVKKMAIEKGFAEYAKKEESQNFVECDSYAALLPKGIPGHIVDHTGKILGQHNGIINYTLGQRKLNIGGLKEPYYVLKIDAKNNSVVAGPKDLAYSDEVKATKMNWIVPFDKITTNKFKAKIRYGAELAEATFVKKDKNSAVIRFKKPQFAITPGQSIVLYDKDVVIGGGIIS